LRVARRVLDRSSAPITQADLPQPEMSCRRNRSEATVMVSHNHTIKRNIASASIRKFSIGKTFSKEEHYNPPLFGALHEKFHMRFPDFRFEIELDLSTSLTQSLECGLLSFEAVFMPYNLTMHGRRLIERLAESNLQPSPEETKVVSMK
jgi:hypothetical protein